MKREDMTQEAFDALLTDILQILMEKGPKATTMESVASSLKISKKTLYEIFPSKSEMVEEAILALHNRLIETHRKIFESSSNIMEAMFRGFLHQRDFMRHVNVNFFRDMDCHFAEEKRKADIRKRVYYEDFVNLLKKGVEQGYFRKDINFMVQCRMISIQMESLKRMEELFPPDITLLEVYDSINIGFLRSIATPKGMKILDSLIEELETNKNTDTIQIS